MARLCDTCLNYNEGTDDFRQKFDDQIVIDGDGREQHFCPMYDDHIPHGIYHEGEDCEWYRRWLTSQSKLTTRQKS